MTDTEIRDVPPLHDVDIRLLRVFKVVVESAGFSAAEEKLSVGRSTISKHISGLEVRFGFKLCERGRSGFSVTPHGETVYAAIIELLDALDGFRAKVAAAKGFLSGQVNLWTMDNSHNEKGNPLSSSLERFKRRPGNVQLWLNAASPKAVEDAVAAGQAHVGLTIAKGDLPGICYLPIFFETTSMYCSKKHPRFETLTKKGATIDELAGCDVVTRGYLRNEGQSADRVWNSSASSGHVETTLQLILSGHYVGIVPDHMADRWVANGTIGKVAVQDSEAKTSVYLLLRRKVLANPAVRALVEDILDIYGVQKSKARDFMRLK